MKIDKNANSLQGRVFAVAVAVAVAVIGSYGPLCRDSV